MVKFIITKYQRYLETYCSVCINKMNYPCMNVIFCSVFSYLYCEEIYIGPFFV